ncbi:M28 family peptidase, partial [Pseudacidovorax intermedius]
MTPFDLLDRIGQATHDGLGITRESYGEGESAALTLLTQEAEAMGLAAETDRAGNLWLRIAADRRDAPAVVIGSHVDSVPQGGNYDGLAGVVAGIAVLQALAADWQSLPPLRVLALRGEESAWYGRAYVGSLALL